MTVIADTVNDLAVPRQVAFEAKRPVADVTLRPEGDVTLVHSRYVFLQQRLRSELFLAKTTRKRHLIVVRCCC